MSKNPRFLAATLGIYALLLFSILPLTPLWLDEIQQFGNTRSGSLADLMRWAQLNAGASPLPYLLQRVCVDLFGYSAFAARMPAALCSVLSGVVFVAISKTFLDRGRWFAVAMFLILPIQFRYGMEARAYSQGLLFSLLSFWLFLELEDRYSPGLAALYGLSVVAGLYSQPLTLFPALAQAACSFRKRRAILWWICVAIVSYLPWYLPQRMAQARYALTAPPTAFFSWRQIHPLVLLHAATGGGYACALPLLALVVWGIRRERLLLYTAAFALAGPILMDIVFNYFFAERQLLFAMPALVLLAAQGIERLSETKTRAAAWALVAVFVVAATVKDFRQSTTPRDDLAATAAAIAARLPPGACVMAAPPGQIAFYLFFRPELNNRVCEPNSTPRDIMVVSSVYTTAQERFAPAGLALTESIGIGQSELAVYTGR
jgi:uncharacterized membrane protein